MYCFLLREQSKEFGKEKKTCIPTYKGVNQPKTAKKRAQTASAGNGRRPHPRFLSSRLRFCPAARIRPSQLTRHSSRKRKRRMPCQSLPSANNGSTHTLRFLRAFLEASVLW